MPLNRTLVLLASDPAFPVPDTQLVQRCGLLERLAALGDEVCSFGEDLLGLPALPNADALTAKLTGGEFDAFLIVEPTQLFLDKKLVQRGLEKFEPDFHDLFTQWEHCRLPIGVGVRAISTRAWLGLGADSPADALDRIRLKPAGRKFCYEVERRVSFQESLFDARFRPEMDALLAGDIRRWDLTGFLIVAHGHEQLAYEPPAIAPRVDERLMPAAYGFESPECASFPTYVMFDVTNLCNARCVHCPQSLRDEVGKAPEFLLKKEHQSLEVFRHVIDECSEHQVDFVRITADGEPLVHPQIFEMLEYARDRGVGPVGLTTNASLLRPDRAERLLESGIAMVDFSLDAASLETFEKIRVGLSYERTIENVQNFLRLRAERGSNVRVVVSFVKQEANLHEVEDFREEWEPLVDEVVVREMISNVGLNDPSESAWPGWDARWPCAHFFRRVVINHQGLLKACPIDWEQRTTNLPVRTASLAEQWHDDFYWSHRMQHLNDRFAASSACKNCPDWAGTPWDLGYEKIVQRLVGNEEDVAA